MSEPSRTAAWAEELVEEAKSGHDVGAEHPTKEQQVLDRIERARKRKAKLRDTHITLAHGAGGKASHTLTEALFLEAFHNPLLELLDDQAVFEVPAGRLALTTDSFVVSPLFFPGGSIGDLAVNGTVNDLAVSGARPRYLTAGFVLEEGFPVDDLRRVVDDMARAAEAAGVQIVTGDTKVVERGKGDGCYINTAGVGIIEHDLTLGPTQVRPGDRILVSGPVGDHGITIMLARGDLDIQADITSDTAPVHELTAALVEAAGPGLRCMRDATRGGVATILNEVASASQLAVIVDEADVPARRPVVGASEILGIDPLYVACEGRFVAFVAPDAADAALGALREHPAGAEATFIGEVRDDPPGLCLARTEFGGTRIVDVLVGDPLPRIC